MKSEEKIRRESEKSRKTEKNSKEKLNDSDKKTLTKTPSRESLDVSNKKPEPKQEPEVAEHEEEKIAKLEEKIEIKIEEKAEVADEVTQKSPLKSPLKFNKSPEKFKLAKTPEKLEEKSPEKPSKDKLKVELKIERKKSPKRIEKPKVNIFLEDSDEVDEFEKITTEVKSRWTSPDVFKPLADIPKIVPAPIEEYKMNDPSIPEVVESPERSPIIPSSVCNNIFKSSVVTMEKSPTPSPPPRPTKVRNVCSFLSDIASGNIFSGLGLGNGLYNDDSSNVGLNFNDYNVDTKDLLTETKKLDRKTIIEPEKVMEPDTTADKLVEKAPEKSSTDDSDSDDSDSDTSSSSDSDSDDTTSESEDSSESSSDDDVPSFTRGFGRFDASSMPMVTQIKPTTTPVTPTTQTVTSRFQPQQNIIKPPALATNITKTSLYTTGVVQALPTVSTPFSVGAGIGAFAFPMPFKIYSLRDAANSEIIFPYPITPSATPAVTPAAMSTIDKTEKDKKSTEKVSEKDKDRRDRKRSRSHSRERDRKRFKDDRRKSPPRKRSTSPSKKRHEERSRQADERKDSRRRDSSPRHSSHSSRSSHVSR